MWHSWWLVWAHITVISDLFGSFLVCCDCFWVLPAHLSRTFGGRIVPESLGLSGKVLASWKQELAPTDACEDIQWFNEEKVDCLQKVRGAVIELVASSTLFHSTGSCFSS
eukprot:4096586-Amphidinium_carterae.1